MTGQMRKSMANFNTYVHRGQNVISSKAFNRKDKNSDLQKVQRASFKLMGEAWVSLGGFAESGFPVRPERLTPFNYFMALNLPNAIDNSGETPVINYELMQIAKGTHPGVSIGSSTMSDTEISVDYISNIDFPNAVAEDVITLLAKTTAGVLFSIKVNRGTESTGNIQLPMNNVARENVEFVYMFVTSADGKKASNSLYLKPD